MKAILFFVPSGRVRESHREAAAKIAEVTGKRVAFRNATTAEATGERPELCEGVAGQVPPAYAGRPVFSDEGQLVSAGSPAKPRVDLGDRPLNALGLPDGEGCPEDREALKEALEAEGIEFHSNAKTEKLADLYLAHFYPAPTDESGAE